MTRLSSIIRRGWTSPTLTTWSSLLARLSSMLLLLPFILRSFPAEEVALWLLFGVTATLQVVADIGFSQTFSRALSNARGGATVAQLARLASNDMTREESVPSVPITQRILSVIRPVYGRIAFLAAVLLVTLGTYSIESAITRIENVTAGWVSWGIVLAGTVTSMWGNVYVSYLIGTERVAQLRRWETLFSLVGIFAVLAVNYAGGTLLVVVLVQQVFIVLGVLRNRYLCCADVVFRQSYKDKEDVEILNTIWPAAWRSGIGVLMSFGIIQASTFFYARVSSGAELASYLLGLRFIQLVSQISIAPFYSKLPTLSRLYAERNFKDHLVMAKRGMRLSHISFLVCFTAVGVGSDIFFRLIKSNTSFVDMKMWLAFGAAFFLERVGAMHLQLYSITNHIIWHIANGLTGIAMLISGFVFFKCFGVIGLPLAMFLSYAAIYCPISCIKSYSAFDLSFRTFDWPVTLAPLLITAIAWGIWMSLGLNWLEHLTTWRLFE